MITLEQQAADAFARSQRLAREVALAFHEFNVAAQNHEWERAEDARLRIVALTEGQTDAFLEGTRAVARLGGEAA